MDKSKNIIHDNKFCGSLGYDGIPLEESELEQGYIECCNEEQCDVIQRRG